jgi:uncharacterized protein
MKGIRPAFSKVFRLLLAVSLVFPAAALTLQLAAQQVDSLPKPTDYVSDDAHVLSPEAIARIDSICAQLDHSQANAQVAVVTVPTMDGDDAFSYATRLYSHMGIGKKGSDRGVLIFFAIQDRKRAMIVGYGLEGILPDAKTGDIGRSVTPALRAGEYGDAALSEVSQVAQVIAADAKITLNDEGPMPAPMARPMRHSGGGAIKLIIIVIVLIFFGGNWLFRLLFGLGLMNSWRGGGWGGGGGMGGGWGGGGGGGWGGGGGGGGGGFVGFGGGDTGGGGSSGSW